LKWKNIKVKKEFLNHSVELNIQKERVIPIGKYSINNNNNNESLYIQICIDEDI
jgi:hypothetical protein